MEDTAAGYSIINTNFYRKRHLEHWKQFKISLHEDIDLRERFAWCRYKDVSCNVSVYTSTNRCTGTHPGFLEGFEYLHM